jgi:hypothetical protein
MFGYVLHVSNDSRGGVWWSLYDHSVRNGHVLLNSGPAVDDGEAIELAQVWVNDRHDPASNGRVYVLPTPQGA